MVAYQTHLVLPWVFWSHQNMNHSSTKVTWYFEHSKSSNIFVHHLLIHITWLNMPLQNIWMILPNFQNYACFKKIYLKNNQHHSLHLAWKYGQTLNVSEHYLFLKAHRFPPVTLSENILLLVTDTVCRQITKHTFSCHTEAIVLLSCLRYM